MARKRRHTREFKLAALARLDVAPDVTALARDLGVERALLYRWQKAYLKGGADGLRSLGRPRPILLAAPENVPPECRPPEPVPPPAPAVGADAAAAAAAAVAPELWAARRIAELERKLGQQALELDFFRAALRHVRASRRSSGGPGGAASTR